jgi:polygalacturonase
MHFTISRSDSVRIIGVTVKAPEDSPNTDGIHISESTNVAIQNAHIGTGNNSSLSQGGTKHNKIL